MEKVKMSRNKNTPQIGELDLAVHSLKVTDGLIICT